MEENKTLNLFNKWVRPCWDKRQIDIREIIARKAVESLFNNMRLEPSKDAPAEWVEFINNITNNNPTLFLKLKGAEKFASKIGSYYACFEIWEGKILIDIATPAITNQYLRLSQGEGFAAIVNRTYNQTKTYNGLMTKECWTTYDVNRQVLQTSTIGNINADIFTIKAPKYILDHNTSGIFIHDYGVLPVKQFLNKSIVDFEYNEITLSDTFPVFNFIDEINNFLFDFLVKEWNLDHTRIIGRLSWQDQSHMNDTPNAKVLSKLAQSGDLFELPWYKLATGNISKNEYIKSDLIIQTIGSDNNIEKMQTTFDGTRHIGALNNMLSFVFKSSGYEWDTSEGSSSYDNTASIMNINKTDFQTTKMKKTLREEDWMEFFQRMAHAYFKKIKGLSDMEAKEKAKECKKYVVFEVVSNLLNDFLKNDERTIALYQSGLMTKKQAVENINPHLSEEDIKEVVNELDAKQQEQENMLYGNTSKSEINERGGENGDKDR